MEYRLWLECSKQSVGRMVRRIEIPWERLRDSAALLGMDSEHFIQFVKLAWDGNTDAYSEGAKEAGATSFNQSEARQILRLRTDCTR